MKNHIEQKRSGLNLHQGLSNMSRNNGNSDIYNSRRKVETWKRTMAAHGENGKVVVKFLDRLKFLGKSYTRIADYAFCCNVILKINNAKQLKDWDKEDCQNVVNEIVDKNYCNSMKASLLRTVKKIVHFAKTDEIIEKKDGTDYCAEVRWIVPGSFRDKYEKIKHSDLLTEEEFLRFIEAIPRASRNTRRDTALYYVGKEGAYRPGELLNMRINGVEFKDNYCTVTTYGKTGAKTLTLVLSYKPLLEWMNEHPERENPDAYLWYEDNRDGRLSYDQLSRLTRRITEAAGLKKRVWLYLLRHTQLTEVEKQFGSSITDRYGNWTRGSTMRSRYVHLANSDQEKAVLKKYGLLKEDQEESLLKPKSCPRCSEQNSPDKKRCTRCGFILDRELAMKYAIREQNASRSFDRRLKRVEQVLKQNTETIKWIADHLKLKASVPT